MVRFFIENDRDLWFVFAMQQTFPPIIFFKQKITLFIKQLAGITVPHNSDGTHLDYNSKNKDPIKMENSKKV